MLMTDVESIRRFVTAGNATVTLSSKKTGDRVTLKFRGVKEKPDLYFVNAMADNDNEGYYAYLGLLDRGSLRRTSKSRFSEDCKSFKAAKFFCDHILGAGRLPDQLEVRHEGRCGRCARKLTTPESIDRGIGPECWGKIGGGE